MNIAKGVTVGPYEILAHIGAGGMGEVWRARDKRIGRDVAIKVLPESFSAGDERVKRFEQEARAAGALNHPGLVTIFDVGTTDGSPYIVMELLEGETLRDAIGEVMAAPLPLRKAIDYAVQMASALSVAHEKGIIHRDLKPENIFITSDSRVKILDFGLAKLAEDATDVDGRHRTARHLTSAGMVVGTPGYMSPEQVRARPLDYRTDIFSFGAVLYEMLCGRRAFDNPSAVETMNAVANDDPEPLTSVEPKVPAALDAIVRHCLEKNPRERFQSARDLAFQLRTLPDYQNSRTDSLRPLPAVSEARTQPVNLLPYRATIALLAVATVAAAGFALLHRRGGDAHPISRTYKQLTFGSGLTTSPTLSPDGKMVAYVSSDSGNKDIYIQQVTGRTAIDITGDSKDDDSEPAFSPDGSQIAFRSERDGGGIFVMGVTGESPKRLTHSGHHPSWSPDGTRIVFSSESVGLRPDLHPRPGNLSIVDTRTDALRPLLQWQRNEHDVDRDSDGFQPSWSPHGKRIAYWGVTTSGRRDIWTIDPDAAQPKQTVVRVTSDPALHWNPVWSPDGKYLYFGSDRDGTLNLWRVPMDEESGQPVGAAEPLMLPAHVSGHFAVSRQGDLVYSSVTRAYRLIAFPFDPATGKTGAARPLFGGSQEISDFELSPDRQSIAFTTGGAQEDLFIANTDGTRLRQLTNDAARDRGVAWSSDGKTLYIYSNRDGPYRIWSIHADGSGLTRVTDDADLRQSGARAMYWPDVSPDGRTLVARTDRATVLVHLDRPAGHRLEMLGFLLAVPRWSPDGESIMGNTNGRNLAVYSLQTRRLQTVLARGPSPQWLADGRHIAFFEKESIGIVDLDHRRVTTSAFTPPPGVEFDNSADWPRISRDGSTIYVGQTLEQSDIWMARFNTP